MINQSRRILIVVVFLLIGSLGLVPPTALGQGQSPTNEIVCVGADSKFGNHYISLFAINVDNSALRDIWNNPGFDPVVHVSWSHDGQKLAFVLNVGTGQGELNTIDANGKNLKTVYRINGKPYSGLSFPAWSPDDKQIVFSSYKDVVGSKDPIQKLQILTLATGKVQDIPTDAVNALSKFTE